MKRGAQFRKAAKQYHQQHTQEEGCNGPFSARIDGLLFAATSLLVMEQSFAQTSLILRVFCQWLAEMVLY